MWKIVLGGKMDLDVLQMVKQFYDLKSVEIPEKGFTSHKTSFSLLNQLIKWQ